MLMSVQEQLLRQRRHPRAFSTASLTAACMLDRTQWAASSLSDRCHRAVEHRVTGKPARTFACAAQRRQRLRRSIFRCRIVSPVLNFELVLPMPMPVNLGTFHEARSNSVDCPSESHLSSADTLDQTTGRQPHGPPLFKNILHIAPNGTSCRCEPIIP